MKKKVLFALIAGFINSSHAAVVPGHLIDVVYSWPQQLWETDVNMTVVADPGPNSTYYWSHFFDFANNSSSALRYGYTGLQTIGNGKQVIFSIWNALTAQGVKCAAFGGEGIGYNCKLSYNFSTGHTYRFRVWRLTSDNTGDWWGAWVLDVANKVETTIGFIKSPPNSGLITTSYLFDEYFTSVPSCASMAYAKISFSNLTGNLGASSPKLFSKRPEGPCVNYIFATYNGNDVTVSSPKP